MTKKFFSTASILLLSLGLAACNSEEPTPLEEEVEAPTTDDPNTENDN
ncbi:hypothetical protein [Ureibacillus chungkukjangi]|uniref:Uncharacterized protein n=1 Tax=Ureibacillus chungkukjangi TaxID=1202712 RepID=A0A318TQP2_9BACL|nr:hypothetical protein [Ureibacillus chungkukjangi]PYF06120.1 hypothetical protein BJ095_11281 [Ureibacillus chungkukjangi]